MSVRIVDGGACCRSLLKRIGGLGMIACLWLSGTESSAQNGQPLELAGPWISQTNVTHDGVDALQSPSLRGGIVAQATWVSSRVIGPGTLSFWWRLTAISDLWTGADFRLCLQIGGEERAATSEEPFRDTGPDQWSHIVTAVPAGDQEVEWWLGTLGGCTDPAVGTAWLDEAVFTPSYPSITRVTPRSADNGCHLECQAVPGTRLVLQGSADLVAWDDIPGSTQVAPADGCVEFDPPCNAGGRGFYRLRIAGP